jgi:hypothetical protein
MAGGIRRYTIPFYCPEALDFVKSLIPLVPVTILLKFIYPIMPNYYLLFQIVSGIISISLIKKI